MSVSSSVISFEHGKVLNEFIDCGELFVKEAAEVGPEYNMVAKIIVESLLRRTDLDLADPAHPFNVYATEHPSRNIRQLANTLMDKVQGNARERSAVVSFFASGGANRDMLNDLLESYYEFADCVTEGSCDGEEEEDDDSSSESSYDNNPNYA